MLLFEYQRRDDVLQVVPTGPVASADRWLPGAEEQALVSEVFGRRVPTLLVDADRRAPELARQLDTRIALLMPLATEGERVGLVIVGFDASPPSPPSDDVIEVAAAYETTLEFFRLRRRDQDQRGVRALIEAFSEQVGDSLNLSRGLEGLCGGANQLLGADRTSVWIHDRRPRELVLRASTVPNDPARDARVRADDPHAIPANAMRQGRAEVLRRAPDAQLCTITVPLRGRRRALGTIVFDDVAAGVADEADVLDRADELGRQLSGALENFQLLDSVLRSRRELENAFDSIAHLVVVSDRGGRIVHVNEAFVERAKRARDQLIDRPLAECVGPELAAWLSGFDRGAERSPPPLTTREIVDPVLGGPFVVTVTEVVDQQRERAGLVIVARDVTRQSRLEAEREVLHRRLGQSEKLAALGQFVAGVAHELNNPLQAVLGHLELLRVTGALPKALRRDAQTIYREADRAAKIVRNLLVFAGSRRVATRAVSLNSVLKKVVALRLGACRAHGIEVVRHYAGRLPRVQGDPLMLHQAFLNVLMNAEQAIVAAGRGGRIEIETTLAASGDRASVTIRDTGPGLSPDVLPRVFEPFFTTKDVGQGTGLGLAITYGIVQEHDGTISAANHPEGGALFTVELPVQGGPVHDDD